MRRWYDKGMDIADVRGTQLSSITFELVTYNQFIFRAKPYYTKQGILDA